MRAKHAALVLSGVLAVYFALIGYRGVFLLTRDSWGLKLLGLAALLLPVVGAWAVVAEWRFGADTQRLAGALDEPVPDLPRTPSGRVLREGADALFAQRKRDVEADPADWRRWYLLAEAYNLAGDRKRARETMRKAIALAPADLGR